MSSRESAFLEATDDLIRAALGILQFHYGGPSEHTEADVAALHHRLTDAALAYLDAPSIYARPDQ